MKRREIDQQNNLRKVLSTLFSIKQTNKKAALPGFVAELRKVVVVGAGGVGGGVSAPLSPAGCCENIKGTPELKVLSHGSWTLRVRLLQDRSSTQTTGSGYCIFSVASPLFDNPTTRSLASKEARHPNRSKHSHSSASDPGASSQCRRPGWSPQRSFPCSLASRPLQCSCPTGRGACCHCSANGGRGRRGHCRLLKSKEGGE